MRLVSTVVKQYEVEIDLENSEGKPVGLRLSFPSDDTVYAHFSYVKVEPHKKCANQIEINLER